jgi:hypothetical protein
MANMIEPVKSSETVFKDSIAEFSFQFYSDSIDLSIKNISKLQKPIIVFWDKMTYVDENKIAKRVIHGNIKIIDKMSVQIPSIIPPDSKIEDTLFPVDNISYDLKNGWVFSPIFKYNYTKGFYKYFGKNIGLYISLEHDSTVLDYYFVFNIEKFKEISIVWFAGVPKTNISIIEKKLE